MIAHRHLSRGVAVGELQVFEQALAEGFAEVGAAMVIKAGVALEKCRDFGVGQSTAAGGVDAEVKPVGGPSAAILRATRDQRRRDLTVAQVEPQMTFKISPRARLGGGICLIRKVDEQGRLQEVVRRQEQIAQVEFLLQFRRLREPRHANDLLDTEPESLPILKVQRQTRSNADAAIAVEVTVVALDKLLPPVDVIFQRDQVIDRQRSHAFSFASFAALRARMFAQSRKERKDSPQK